MSPIISDELARSLWEATKEPLRLLLLALVSTLIVHFTSVPQPEVTITIMVIGLKTIDRFLHTWGKETDNDQLLTGLTRF